MMQDYEPLVSLAVALGVGLLIGLQRQHSAQQDGQPEGQYLGGIRTYPMYALAGGLCVLLAQKLTLWLLPATLVVLTAPLILAYMQDLKEGKDRGLTSEVSFVLAFLLGVMSCSDGVIAIDRDRYLIVAAIGVAITTLLATKKPLHGLASRISSEDLYGTLQFLIMAVIVLPLLPNRPIGPLEIINPFSVGLMVVLMSGVSFIGYVAIKLVGAGGGLGLTGLIGGVVSSTAVTLSVSGRAKQQPTLADSCALAVMLASTVMGARVTLVISALNRELLKVILIPLAVMIASGLLVSIVLFFLSRKHKEGAHGEMEFKNPFEIGRALKFAAIFIVVMFISKAAAVHFGNTGTYIAALLGGLTDMDAITLSMARMAGSGLDMKIAAVAILIAAASNTVVKTSLATSLGGWNYGKRLIIGYAAVLAATAAAGFMVL
jgi:uncharacterized membrane protein (DUF4010 family)